MKVSHCWHRDTFQHVVPNHRDEKCCNCGATRCLQGVEKAPAGHGRFLPQNEYITVFNSESREPWVAKEPCNRPDEEKS